MYRKNTATQYIYFGLINSTSGAALTGATVTAYRALDGNAQALATGTTTELGNGQYRFNLSQADTNANNGSYLFTATNAIPVEKTVVFTAADPTDATAFGISRIDAAITSRMATYTQPTGFLAATFPGTVASPTNITAATGVVLSGVTHTGAVIPTVSTVTNGVTVSTNNDKTGYTASTVSDKTGYSLLATTGLGNQTANITGNLSGSVGSVTGAVTVGTMNANVITASAIATDAATEISTAVWATDLQTWPDDQAGSDLYEMLTTITTISGRMPTLHYGVAQAGGASTITLNASASSITDYYVGLAIAITASTGAGQVRTITAYNGTTKVATVDSAWTTNPANGSSFAIIQAAGTSGGGGGTDWTANERTAIRSILGFDSSGTVSLPTVGVMDAIKDKTDLITSSGISVLEDRVNESTITMQYNESTTATVNLDENTTSATLQFVVSSPDGTDILTIANGSITRTSTSFTVTITTAVTATLGQYLWSLRDITGGTNRVVTKGVLTVQNAASV